MNIKMKAVILAAGKSSRLYPLTLEKPKCLLEIGSGKTIIEHQIETLQKCGVNKIIVVVGHLKEKIKDFLRDKVEYRSFDDFSRYNNLHTLYSIKDDLDEDFICLFSDVVFGPRLLNRCINSKKDFCLLIHNLSVLKNTMRVKIVEDSIIDIGNHLAPEESEGNFIGVAKFSKKGAELLIDEMEKLVRNFEHDDDYYTISLKNISKKTKVGYEFVGDEPWIEIDFLEDYDKARNKIYGLIK